MGRVSTAPHQIHWPDPEQDVEEGWAACVALLSAGKVRHIGGSNFNVEQLRRIGALATVETLQPPYSLIDRGVASTADAAVRAKFEELRSTIRAKSAP